MSKISADFGAGVRTCGRSKSRSSKSMMAASGASLAYSMNPSEWLAVQSCEQSGNPVLDDLPDEGVLETCVQVNVELVDEVDRVGVVLAADEQVEKGVEHLLLAAGEQVVVDLRSSLSEAYVRRPIVQRRADSRQAQLRRGAVGEDPREGRVQGIEEPGSELVGVELRFPDFVMDARRHLRDVGLEPPVLIDVAARAIAVGADPLAVAAYAAQLRNGPERAATVER